METGYQEMPWKIVGISEMFTPRIGPLYSDKHRQQRALRSHDKSRLKRSKDRRNRRQQELEDELVKSGSEEENDIRSRRPYRKRKSVRHSKIEKVDRTYLGISKAKNKLQNVNYDREYKDLNQQELRYLARIHKAEKEHKMQRNFREAERNNLGDVPRITFNGPQPNVSNINGAVRIRKIPEKKVFPSPSRDRYVSESEHAKDQRQLLNVDSNSDSGAQSDDVIRGKSRSERALILNRAEQLLHNRKLRQEVSSGEDGDSEKSTGRDQPFIQRRVDYPSSSDDDKYVYVKTTVSPSESEFYTDLDVPLPPIPVVSRHSGKSIPSMTKSEIPVYSDDEFDVDRPQRPHTDTYRDPPFVGGRYEQPQTQGAVPNSDSTPKAHRTLNGKGKRVTFYRNGDTDFKGITISITPKEFLNFEALMIHLNDKIETTSGVRYIFGYPSGKEVKSVTEFQPGRCYLVSSTKKPNLTIPYGQSREQFWSNRKPSGGRVRKEEVDLFKKPNQIVPVKFSKPRVITVFKNEERDRKEKVYINPNTKQTFEDLLITIGDMIEEDIQALYTEKKPYRKVESFNQLFNELKNQDEFIACGPELFPVEKLPAPSSNYSTDSVSVKKKFYRLNEGGMLSSWGDLNELDENDLDLPPSPVPNMDYSSGMLTSRDLPLMPPKPEPVDDRVKFKIKGKERYFYPPSILYPDDDGGRPAKKLKLEWVYGYRGKEGSRSLMVYQPTGELLYYIAAVAVFFKSDDNPARGDTQRHYLGHTDEISCLTIHPNEFLVASGQYASRTSPAHIRIWDGRQLTTYHVIGIDYFVHGISAIDFSHQSSGNFMCVSDSSDKHVLSVWDWQREKLIAKTTTTNKAVNCACFYKYDDTLLISYGAEHLYFWRLFWDPSTEREGKLYRDKLSGVFCDDIPKNVTSHAFTMTGDVLTGDSSGSVIVWSKDGEYVFRVNEELSAVMKNAHSSCVSTLCMMNDNSLLSGGGTVINAWDSINSFRFMTRREIPSDIAGHVRTIIPQRGYGADGKIFVGTSKSCVLSGSLPVKFKFIINGHSDELWAVAPVPNEMTFITAAHDRFVLKWSAKSHRLEWRTEMDSSISAIAIDSKGHFVAVGSVTGRFHVLHARSGNHMLTVHCSKAQINTMSYSPDGAMLAIGTYDGYIHIFYVHGDGEKYRKNNIVLRGHQKFVSNIDWSGDSKYLRSCDGDYELRFWNTQRMENEEPSFLRDCNWETHTCLAEHSMMGPWSVCEDGESLSVEARSNLRDIMAVGDNKGRIKLFKYPSSTQSPACRWTKLYSSTVTAVSFLYNDEYLISSAGKFPVLAQWANTPTAQ